MLLFKVSSSAKLLTSKTYHTIVARRFASCSDHVERWIQVGRNRINFVEAGTGERAVLLMPGALGSAWTDFKPQIEKLPALLPNHRLVAWDPPGCGKSRPPNKTYGLDFYETDAKAAVGLMTAIGFNRFSVLGWSDGGHTGLVLAGTYPAVVEKLVVWGANAYITKPEAEFYEGIRNVSKLTAQMREPLEKVYGQEAFPHMWSAWVDGILNQYRKRDGNVCKDVLGNIRAPTCIVHGARDRMIAPEHVPYLAKAIRSTELVHVFPDGTHNVHLKYVDEFNRLVSDFLKK